MRLAPLYMCHSLSLAISPAVLGVDGGLGLVVTGVSVNYETKMVLGELTGGFASVWILLEGVLTGG